MVPFRVERSMQALRKQAARILDVEAARITQFTLVYENRTGSIKSEKHVKCLENGDQLVAEFI